MSVLAAGLALGWPGGAVLVEGDPSGAEAALRFAAAGGGFLAESPSVLDLSEGETVQSVEGVKGFVQRTGLGFDVVPGPLDAVSWARMWEMWPRAVEVLRAWPVPVIADLGRMQPGHGALPLARAVDVLLVLTHGDVAGLHAVRDRGPLLHNLLAVGGSGPQLGVLVRTVRVGGVESDVVRAIRERMDPAVVLGGVVEDAEAAQALSGAGWMRQGARERLMGSPFMGALSDLVGRIQRVWPDSSLPVETAVNRQSSSWSWRGGAADSGHRTASPDMSGLVEGLRHRASRLRGGGS
ncbi:hypothetical protein KIH74_35355 [Kineosporia sp. J2-2]|uniref:MinD-like ATPase involved in chromosome partitioning or flagellar assembly n=1 Tax=Kineosporia corallincola TaxID=2835133 RepID=A0ABS5TU23_9ACTN|nr:hypothetical protein [Kineosporia corallincola]MBT0774275.1 hypothetical protein [Kineosporia corallincola]